jgi:hypothetical protein
LRQELYAISVWPHVAFSQRATYPPSAAHSLGAIRLGRGFALEKLGHFAHQRRFATVTMPDPEAIIGGKPFRFSALR